MCTWCGKVHRYSVKACMYTRPTLKAWQPIGVGIGAQTRKAAPRATGVEPITVQAATKPKGNVITGPGRKPSDKQIKFIDDLLGQLRELNADKAAVYESARDGFESTSTFYGQNVSNYITNLLTTLKFERSNAPKPTKVELPKVANGSYALPGSGMNAYVFYNVWTSATGFVKVRRQEGPNLVDVPWSHVPGILARIAAHPFDAMTRYGLELKHCGKCHKPLTNTESQRMGIGPICRNKMGW